MFARNWLLVWVAFSAPSFASRRPFSLSTLSVISSTVHRRKGSGPEDDPASGESILESDRRRCLRVPSTARSGLSTTVLFFAPRRISAA